MKFSWKHLECIIDVSSTSQNHFRLTPAKCRNWTWRSFYPALISQPQIRLIDMYSSETSDYIPQLAFITDGLPLSDDSCRYRGAWRLVGESVNLRCTLVHQAVEDIKTSASFSVCTLGNKTCTCQERLSRSFCWLRHLTDPSVPIRVPATRYSKDNTRRGINRPYILHRLFLVMVSWP